MSRRRPARPPVITPPGKTPGEIITTPRCTEDPALPCLGACKTGCARGVSPRPIRKVTFRVYPSCCTSAYCGRTDCTGCPNLPNLTAFKAWVEEHDAVVDDPIWCPSVYTARK